MKRSLKEAFKYLARLAAAGAVAPVALLSCFGRVGSLYQLGAQALSTMPGVPGDYLRTSYYRFTLLTFGASSRIQFGSYFPHRDVRVGDGVYIGSYCILGRVEIGDHTQIASGVQILSGRHQHGRDERGQIQGSHLGEFRTVKIGANCWIGAGAIVMADVGEGSTVGAGAVVVKPISAGSVAVGNPARVVRAVVPHAEEEMGSHP